MMSHRYNDDDDHDDLHDDDVMVTKGRHLMAAYGQQTLGNFHSCPNSLLRNKKHVDPAPKNVNALSAAQNKSICLLAPHNSIGTCEAQVQSGNHIRNA